MNLAKKTDRLATLFLWVAGLSILAILAWFLIYVLYKGLPVLNFKFISTPPSAISEGGGVLPELFNSFYILILSLLFSLPVGIGGGIYLAEYAKPNRLTNMIRLSTESLATVPSIVLGLFGAIIFVNVLKLGFTIIGGSLTLALLNLPVLVRVTEDTLRAVPMSFREASLALGATKWQTLRKVIIPKGLPGMITGVTLTAGRALGETAILIFTAGLSTSRHMFDFNPMAMGETLAVHLWYVRSNPIVPDANSIAAGSAALLIIMVLVFNLLIGVPGRILQRRMNGKQGR